MKRIRLTGLRAHRTGLVRALTARKGKLSGNEIEERKAAFVRREPLIGTAERSFTTILEGLRMYLRSKPG